MKILYLHNVHTHSEYANSIQVKSMCKAMASLGHEVILSAPAASSIDAGKKQECDGYSIVFRDTLKSKYSKYFSGKGISRVVENLNPDLIYLRTPLLLKQIPKDGVPVVMEIHNNRMHLGSRLLDRYWTKYIVRSAKKGFMRKIVCISDALSRYWIGKGIASSLIETYHDGFDETFYTTDISADTVRDKLRLPNDKVIVSYIGRLYENRGIDRVLCLAADYPLLQFVIVGGPNDQAVFYKQESKRQGIENIVFTGQVAHEATALYQQASDILLALWTKDVPTINYCSPLKVFEYMASGRTIVAHGFPTIKEVLTDEVNAILVEPESYSSLKQGLDRALSQNDKSRLGNNAREDAFTHYTWRIRAENILKGVE